MYDDREVSAGVKFSDAELIGIPKNIVIGETLVKEGVIEVKERVSGDVKKMKTDEVLKLFKP